MAPTVVLDRGVGVDAVLVVEVDVLDTEAPQGALAGLPDIGGAAVDGAPRGRADVELDPELGSQEDLLAAVGDRAADELLVGVGAVHVGGVQEVAPQLQGALDRGDRLAFVGGAVEGRHAHAAQADLRDLRAVGPESALVHDVIRSLPWGCRLVPWKGADTDIMLYPTVFPLNLPNVLTVLRIMLVPVLVAALLGNTPAGDVLAAVVFALASLTDFVDGYLARSRDSITTFGKLMDPLADKLLIVAALLSLVSLGRLAAWVAMVIITRELAVTVLRMGAAQAGVVMAASMFGKIKTCLQIAAILAVIAVHGQPLWVSLLLYLTVLVTVLSGLDYFFGLRRRLQQVQTQTGA